MNRDIKFRLRDENNKIVGYEKWRNGHWIYSKHQGFWTDEFIPHAEKDQFTGFHDIKDKKEIYEGDIVKVKWAFSDNYCVGVVKYGLHQLFNEGGCCSIDALGFYVEGKIKGEFIEPDREYSFPDIEEVLGNIFENPELLEESVVNE